MSSIKRIIVFLLTLLILSLFAYLYLTYAKFYHLIGEKNLQSPYTSNTFTLENLQTKGSVKYVALGDSLSAGVGAQNVNETFVFRYALNLFENFGKVDSLNLAQRGATTKEVITEEISQAIAFKPDYITLLIGINDVHNKRSRKEFEQNYHDILSELINKTGAQIVVINLPYLGSAQIVRPPYNFLLNYRTLQFNKIISNVVNSFNISKRIKLVDLYQDTYKLQKENPNYYSSDLFHPSGEGYMLWSQVINER